MICIVAAVKCAVLVAGKLGESTDGPVPPYGSPTL